MVDVSLWNDLLLYFCRFLKAGVISIKHFVNGSMWNVYKYSVLNMNGIKHVQNCIIMHMRFTI